MADPGISAAVSSMPDAEGKEDGLTRLRSEMEKGQKAHGDRLTALETRTAKTEEVTKIQSSLVLWIGRLGAGCVLVQLLSFVGFCGLVLALTREKSPLWRHLQEFEPAMTTYTGNTTIAGGHWMGQPILWACVLGFAALTLSAATVAVAASFALSRIGRE
jgi:hypothetical protein